MPVSEMKSILDDAQRTVLERLCASNVLLGFDFDGTLAPIVADPDAARVRDTTRELLAELAKLYPCIVISGRAAADVAARLHGVALRAVVGNHGAETGAQDEAELVQRVRAWRTELDALVALLRGVELEDKGHSLALHYRRAPEEQETLVALRRVAERLPGVRLVGGKKVLNLLPAGAPHKGTALERERLRLGCDASFFIGDDVTDEDVFAEERPGLVTVRVGRDARSRAHYCLARQGDIDALLERMASLRR